MKKKLYIVLPIVLVVIILGAIFYKSDDGVLDTITSKEFNKILNDSEEKIVYIGRPTCPDCVQIQPILEEKLEAEGLTAYYYNTDKAKKKSMDDFNEIKETVGVQYVPTIIYYNGSEEVSRVEYSEYKEDSSILDKLIEEYKLNNNEIQN